MSVVDYSQVLVDGKVDEVKLMEICGTPHDSLDPGRIRQPVDGRCTLCDKIVTRQEYMTLCGSFETRHKRDVTAELDFTDKETSDILERLEEIDWPVNKDDKNNFMDQQSKDNSIKLNILRLLFSNYIGDFYENLNEAYNNHYFWELGKDKILTQEKLDHYFEASSHSIEPNQDVQKLFDDMPKVRVENNGIFLSKYSEPKILNLYKNAKICDSDRCVTHSEDILDFGFIDESEKLYLCENLYTVNNFKFCDRPFEYKCYREKSQFEGDCLLTKSDYVPNQSFHFVDEKLYFFVNGIQVIENFYLSKKEREEIVAKYHPKDNFLLASLKEDYTLYYYLGWHIAMILGILGALYNVPMAIFLWFTETSTHKISGDSGVFGILIRLHSYSSRT